jgi:hypothetical protein
MYPTNSYKIFSVVRGVVVLTGSKVECTHRRQQKTKKKPSKVTQRHLTRRVPEHGCTSYVQAVSSAPCIPELNVRVGTGLCVFLCWLVGVVGWLWLIGTPQRVERIRGAGSKGQVSPSVLAVVATTGMVVDYPIDCCCCDV